MDSSTHRFRLSCWQRLSVISVAVGSVAGIAPVSASSDGGKLASVQVLCPGYATKVSGDGSVVVGVQGTWSGVPFRWTAATGAVNIASAGVGSGVSCDGVMAAGSLDSGGSFRWTQAGGTQPLAPDNLTDLSSKGDAACGTIYPTLAGFQQIPWRWSTTGGVQMFSGLEKGAFANGISGDGKIVVGGTWGTVGSPAAYWNQFGAITILTSDTGIAYDASFDGSVIVGRSFDGNNHIPVRWVGGAESPISAQSGAAYGVSNDGEVIVGELFSGGGFVWTAASGFQALPSIVPYGVSADGSTIVGYSINGSGQPEAVRMVLPTPPTTPFNCDPDADGDGLPDDWETDGIPYTDSNGIEQRWLLDQDGDGQSDSDPNHKDLWVEIDAMSGRAPSEADLLLVRDSFASAPVTLVSNPDGLPGIILHAIIDETNLPLFDFPNGFVEFDQLKSTASSGTTLPGYFGRVADRNDPEAAGIREARRKAYRYCIFANTHSGGTSSGKGESGGNDFMVTLGGWFPAGGTSDQKAGTFMHELGHTLGLGHGGRDAATGADDVVYKPNYYSVMNYTWQTPEPWMAPNTWPLSPGKPGYSAAPLLDLNEADLFECQGIGAPSGAFGGFLVPHNTHNSTSSPVATFNSFMCCAIDWDHDMDVDCFGNAVAVDLNHLYNANPASPGELLKGREDWSKLVYDFKTSPDFADGVHVTASLVVEITFEEHQAVLASLPPYCAGDTNLDRTVNIDDLLQIIGHWGDHGGDPADINGSGVVDIDDLLQVIGTWGPCG